MHTVRDVLDTLEHLAPARYAYSFDHIGLQVGDASAGVERIVVSLDPSLAAVRFAIEQRAQMLVSHHPVIWDPLKSLTVGDRRADVVRLLIKHDIAFAAAHTNWDCAPGGINNVLAEKIGLQNVRPVGSSSDKEQFKFVVFGPTEAQEGLIDAMSTAGAGSICSYERCAFVSEGTGSFIGGRTTNPTIGEPGKIEHVAEARIEMVCAAEALDKVVAAMKRAHPYEEPAYDIVPVKQGGGFPICRIGILTAPITPEDFCSHLDESLETKTLLCKASDKEIKSVVVCGGAAADEWRTALEHGADAFVTGEVPHHLMVEASESGVTIAAAGHYATENPGTMRLADRLAEKLEVVKFQPGPGTVGRPI